MQRNADLCQGVPRQILRPFPVLRKDKVGVRKLIKWTGIFSARNGTRRVRQNRTAVGEA